MIKLQKSREILSAKIRGKLTEMANSWLRMYDRIRKTQLAAKFTKSLNNLSELEKKIEISIQ